MIIAGNMEQNELEKEIHNNDRSRKLWKERKQD